MLSSILSKNERKKINFTTIISQVEFFRSFFWTPRRHFKINWLLVPHKIKSAGVVEATQIWVQITNSKIKNISWGFFYWWSAKTCLHCILCPFPSTTSASLYTCRGPFIYHVSTFVWFFDPLPLTLGMFSTKNKQKLAFSDLLLP